MATSPGITGRVGRFERTEARMPAAAMLDDGFGSFADLLRVYAREQSDKPALILSDRILDFAALDAQVDRVAVALQRDGFRSGDIGAVCVDRFHFDAVVAFFGILRAGGAVAPVPAWPAPADLVGMLADSEASVAFVDAPSGAKLQAGTAQLRTRLVLVGDDRAAGPLQTTSFADWWAPVGATPTPVEITPEQPFNVIYSSGTTGRPKGIVLSQATRWVQLSALGYTNDAVALVSLSLYSNMALLSLLPALAHGATVVLMPKFDVAQFLELSERWRVTHAMLVPVQIRRLLDHPDFDRHDLSSYRLKLVGGAPCAPAMLREVLARWPGGMVQTYGMTEGGGACSLAAHEFPDKLHTVGKPSPSNEILLIDEFGEVAGPGEIGEVVGRSRSMMTGYLHQPGLSRELEWYAPDGRLYLRSGDLGRFDSDGFLELVGRRKDMIISGGFNIYPIDLENVLLEHPAVRDCSVVGVASPIWGETPVAFVVPSGPVDRDELLAWTNARVGKNQRMNDLELLDVLPRNDNGKVVKRELRARYERAVSRRG